MRFKLARRAMPFAIDICSFRAICNLNLTAMGLRVKPAMTGGVSILPILGGQRGAFFKPAMTGGVSILPILGGQRGGFLSFFHEVGFF